MTSYDSVSGDIGSFFLNNLIRLNDSFCFQSPVGSSEVSLDQSLASGVDMRSSAVRVAGDYTKRKNVFRMSTVKPCRSEILIQAESSEDFADWVQTLQQQVAVSTEAELVSLNFLVSYLINGILRLET